MGKPNVVHSNANYYGSEVKVNLKYPNTSNQGFEMSDNAGEAGNGGYTSPFEIDVFDAAGAKVQTIKISVTT